MCEILSKILSNEGRFTAAEYGIMIALSLIFIEKVVMNI